MKLACFAVDALCGELDVDFPSGFRVNDTSLVSRPGAQVEWELITGRTPRENGILFDLVLSNKSPYNKLGPLKHAPNNKLTRNVIRWLFGRHRFSPMHIPFEKLPFFDVNESLVNLLKKRDRDFGSLCGVPDSKYVSSDIRTIENFFDRFKSCDFLYANYVKSDQISHTEGPNSNAYSEYLRKIKRSISGLVRKHNIPNVIVVGVHGSTPVKSYLNLTKELKGIRDLLYFINSPVARFWPRNNQEERKIEEIMESLPVKKIVNDDLKSKEMPTDNKFGNVIYWLDEGVHAYPDFYRGYEKTKGMHGYLSKDLVPFIFASKELNVDLDVKELQHIMDFAKEVLSN